MKSLVSVLSFLIRVAMHTSPHRRGCPIGLRRGIAACAALLCAAVGPIGLAADGDTYFRVDDRVILTGAGPVNTGLDVFFHVEGPTTVDVPANSWAVVLTATPLEGATGAVVFNPPDYPASEPNLYPTSVDPFIDFDLDFDGRSHGELVEGNPQELHAVGIYIEPIMHPPPPLDPYGNLTLPDGAGLFSAPVHVAGGTQGDFLIAFDSEGTSNVSYKVDEWFSEKHPIGTHQVGRLSVFHQDNVATVVGRHLLYNNSAFDQYDPLPGGADDDAIAIDKAPLLPGNAATFANYSSYDKGINGVVIDVDQLIMPERLDFDDLQFRVGNDNDLAAWVDAPLPDSITVREDAGPGGADRITVIWDDGDILNQWLEITLRAGATTGLVENDVFYFGNAVAESGNRPTNMLVTAADIVGAAHHPRGPANRATVDDPFDFNRDMLVDGGDIALAHASVTSPFSAVRLLDLSPPPLPPPPMIVPEPSAAALMLLGWLVLAARPRRR